MIGLFVPLNGLQGVDWVPSGSCFWVQKTVNRSTRKGSGVTGKIEGATILDEQVTKPIKVLVRLSYITMTV